MLKDLDIKPVLTPVKNPQANYLVDRLQQIIMNMLVTKDIDNKVFDSIDSWGENLASMEWAMRDSYYPTIKATLDQPVFGRDMLFNLASVKDWQVVTAVKQHQPDIDNVRGNARQVMHNHAIGYQVGVEMTGIYRKLDYKKQGPYRIT